MSKRLVYLIVLALLIGLPISTRAQEGEETLKCSDQDTSVALQTAADLIAEAQGQDVAAQYAAILDIRAALAAVDSVCLGLDFEGTDLMVTDPVYVPEGMYRVTATTPGPFFMEAVVLEGECEASGFGGLFMITDAAPDGAETIFTSQGCLTLWEISLAYEPYAVTFEKLR